ncbi:hypothetical protein J2Y41_000235 [Arthrobacter sp. 1088]|nr:hypothetical protein [Arthrobacter sp. 1088]
MSSIPPMEVTGMARSSAAGPTTHQTTTSSPDIRAFQNMEPACLNPNALPAEWAHCLN